MMRCCTPLAFPARAATTLRVHASAQRIHKTEPVVLDHHVFVAGFIEAFTERDGIGHGGVRRPRVYESDHRHRRLLRALGVATAARVQQLPDLPTVADAVPGYEASSVFGVGVPTGTPREITELLNRELDAALADPRIRGRLLELTAIPIPSLAAEFRAEMVATTEKWGRVIRVANIKPE
jgi:Tripartite tricarboxylate transporter family receptor